MHGPNGVSKTYLCGCFTEPEKRYKILSLAPRFRHNIRRNYREKASVNSAQLKSQSLCAKIINMTNLSK